MQRACLLTLGVATLLAACRPAPEPPAPVPEPHRGPILWITVDALRADVLGALGGDPGLTPHLDALAAEADWAEPAIAASSWTVPSMASLFTGLQPYRHGNWHAGRTVLADELETLPEALRELGFRTVAFRSNTWLRQRSGYAQGFDQFYNLARGGRAAAHLSALDGGPELVWAHVLPPHAPYVLYPELRDRLVGAPAELPERVRPAELERWYDPQRALPAEERERLWALYRSNVAHADRVVGGLLDALRRSGRWDEALVIVTADHGEEFGEAGQITHGGNLDRVLIEVPLLIKLPAASGHRPLRPRAHVANSRLFATILELVGGTPGPEVLPSLLVAEDPPALSELYQGNGDNCHSLVAGGEQLLWHARFAPVEPRYYDARLAGVGGQPTAPLGEPAAEIFGRLARAFLDAPPLHGDPGAPPSTEVVRWRHDGASLGEATLSLMLEAEWLRWNGPERPPREAAPMPTLELTPEEREELEALGYLPGD
ncbi:MAG TPA: sulfatase [Thermoanaerobaculia bacterium]|nr:sulfatase [Thermoanaerobaculia bacterium]